jgi:hypothetical protein
MSVEGLISKKDSGMEKYVLVLAPLVALMVGCYNNSGYSTSSNPVSPSNPPDTNAVVSFKDQVQGIFTSNCALSGCHVGQGAQQGMDLSAGSAYNNIVNVKSKENPSFNRVTPFKSDSSYLYFKISGIGSFSGSRMPYGRPPLSTADIEIIKSWIDQGASNN